MEKKRDKGECRDILYFVICDILLICDTTIICDLENSIFLKIFTKIGYMFQILTSSNSCSKKIHKVFGHKYCIMEA